MVIRFLSGIVAGLTIGVVIHEALIAGAGVLVPGLNLSSLLIGAIEPDRTHGAVLVGIFALATGLGATMAAAVAGRFAGWVCGSLWLVPTFLLGSLSGMGNLLWGSLAIACLLGTLAGTRVVMMMDRP